MLLYVQEGSDHTFQIEVFKADDYEGEPIEYVHESNTPVILGN
jgi:hypothetical protein